MAENDQVLEAIETAADLVEEKPTSDIVTLSNGVKLKCKSVPVMMLRQASASIPKPKPPVVKNEEKGREEIWEGDPTYQQAIEEWEEKIGDVGTNVMLMLGTSVDFIPDDVEKPEDEGWLESILATGIEVRVGSVPARYISWLRFYVISTPSDLLAITSVIARKSGVLNKDVQASLDSFRSREERGTDLDSETEERGGNGDPVSGANGRAHLRSGGEG